MTSFRARSYLIALIVVPLFSAGNQAQSAPAAPPQATQTASPSPAPAQSTAPAQKQNAAPVYESATVLKAVTRLVVVDVVAVDKKGEPITDLKQSDFKVLEDGKEQKVRVFNFQQPAPVTANAAPAPAPAKLPENVYTNAPTYNPNNALNVVLLDALNTLTPNQMYARDQMIRFLQKLPEGRPVAVYTLGTRLALLQDFTTDPAVLKEVISKLKSRTSPLLANPTGGPEQEILPAGAVDAGALPAQMVQSIMQFEQEEESVQTDVRKAITLSALTALSRLLAGYPGRKNLLWVSEAFPLTINPNTELTGDIMAGTRNYASEVAAAADALIDAQVAVYPIDARGLWTSSTFSAASTGRDKFGRSVGARPGRMGSVLSAESAAVTDSHGTMEDLAERTGGKAFYNSNDLDGAMRRSMDDGSTYYILAYYPENKDWNGKFRKIQVKLERPGVKLRHRLGYYAVDPKTFAEHNPKQQAIILGEALNLNSPVATALTFKAGVIAPSEATQNKVMVNFGVDPHAISFEVPSDGLHHAKVDCAVQAYSDTGQLVKTAAQTVDAALKQETYIRAMRSIFPCQLTFDLPAGSYRLRLAVRDDSTGLIGTANAKLIVAQAAAPADAMPSEKKP
jgi:VWFA-related protein